MAELKLCEQCGKEPAAVFLGAKDGDAKKQRSLCLNCAKESGIPEAEEFLSQKTVQRIGSQKCVQCGELPAVVFVSKYSARRLPCACIYVDCNSGNRFRDVYRE